MHTFETGKRLWQDTRGGKGAMQTGRWRREWSLEQKMVGGRRERCRKKKNSPGPHGPMSRQGKVLARLGAPCIFMVIGIILSIFSFLLLMFYFRFL